MLSFYLIHDALDGDRQDRPWDVVDTVLQQSWSSKLKLQRLRSGLVATTSSPLVPLAILKEASEIITERFGTEAKSRYPAALLADTDKSESLVARGEGYFKRLPKSWELYASPSAFDEMRIDLDRSVELTFDGLSDSRYGLLQLDENDHFLFAQALVRGDEAPCFYCGSRRHTPTTCPSKQLFPSGEALEKLARSPLAYANSCFLKYLTTPQSTIDAWSKDQHWDSRDDRLSVAHRAFYDLKDIFQLRFLRLFFGNDRLDWEKIRNCKGLNGQGGPTWLALDCLRVGDLGKADHYVKIGTDHDPADWKPTCVLGFLSIEREELGKAEYHFEKALDLSRRTPQRILLNLLLARVCYLNQEARKARGYARSAMLLDRWCQDALYQLISLDFDLTHNEQPLQGLERLARLNARYWMRAYIDPDLASHSAAVHPCLSRIEANARQEAEFLSREAQKELTGVKALLPEDSKILREAQDLASSLGSKSNSEGYLDSAERAHGARVLKALCRKALEEQQQELKTALAGLRTRIDEVNRATEEARDDIMPEAMDALRALSTRIELTRRNAALNFMNTYQDFMAKKAAYATQLTEIERALKTWRTRKQVGRFVVAFLIRTSGLLFATFAFVLFFPFLMGIVQSLAPQWKLAIEDYGSLQRAFIVFGVVTSLAAAAASSCAHARGTEVHKPVAIRHEAQPKLGKKQIKGGRR